MVIKVNYKNIKITCDSQFKDIKNTTNIVFCSSSNIDGIIKEDKFYFN